MDNLFSHIAKLRKDYNFILNYPIELKLPEKNIIAKGWFSSIYIELLKVSFMQFLIWAYRQLTIAS